jgi:hypothetical protein
MRQTTPITPRRAQAPMPRALVPRALVPRALVPRALVPRALVLGALVLATVLLAGCGSSRPLPPRATADGCYAFAVRALQRHRTVTAIPPACRGLSSAQVNEAVDRAIRAAVGPLPKAAERARAAAESRYLAGLIRPVPAQPAAPSQPGPPGPAPSTLPADLAALAAWIATAAAGGYLLAGRLSRDPQGQRRLAASGTPPPVIAAHAGLGVAGLAVWIAYLAAAIPALAWIAVGVTFLLAGLGMATLLTASSDVQPAAPAQAAQAPAGPRPGRRPPVIVIALHGALATATILLVLLAAIGAA